MSTRGVADIVFCLDSSRSMRPCFDEVRQHLGDFVAGLQSKGQVTWDLRLDFVAHSAGSAQGGTLHNLRSLYHPVVVKALYGGTQGKGRFFTTDAAEFSGALAKVEVGGDEASLVALDCCLDFPWRDAATCHRVVIFMTDERCEGGVAVPEMREKVPALQKKIQALRVMLYMVAPDSKMYSELSAVDRSEYEVVNEQGNGLADVNFAEVLSYIGKSVSVSQLQAGAAPAVERGIFGQAGWVGTNETAVGD